MCWFEPPEASKRLIKNCCQLIVDEIKRLEREGDPSGISIEKSKELLDYLYKPEICKEKLRESSLDELSKLSFNLSLPTE
jgi:hypothetical protein